ncbi:aconitase, partial [Armillaria gallica]
ITVRSFARIHETNLKKQGMLALTFVNPEDYEKVKPSDKVDILGLETFAPGKNLTLVLKHEDGSKEEIPLAHSFNFEGQIAWFKAGSALNLVRKQSASKHVADFLCRWQPGLRPMAYKYLPNIISSLTLQNKHILNELD